MIPSETDCLDVPNPLPAGWVALSPAHLFPWILLIAGFLQDGLYALLPYAFHTWWIVGWGFTLLRWALGGVALAVASQERSRILLGPLRQGALVLAAIVLGLRICMSLISQFAFRMGMPSPNLWLVLHVLFTVMGLGALILLLAERNQEAGGRFDAAVAALVFAGGLGWIGLPVLVVAALKGQPLLAAQWQALRNPKESADGGWFDGWDEGQRLRNLGSCALALATASLALVGRLILNATYGHMNALGSNFGWALADILSALLAGLLLGIYITRRARGQQGRGPAIAALLITGLPLLFLLVVIVFVVLILTDVIHFHLF